MSVGTKAKKGDLVVYGVETRNVYISRTGKTTRRYNVEVVISATREGRVTRATPLYTWPPERSSGPLHRNDPWKWSDEIYVIPKSKVDVDAFARKYEFSMFNNLDSVKAALSEFKR